MLKRSVHVLGLLGIGALTVGACSSQTIIDDLTPDAAFFSSDGGGTHHDGGTTTTTGDGGTTTHGDGGTTTGDSGLPRPKVDSGTPVDDSGTTGGNCPDPAPTKADLDQPDGAPGWNPPLAAQTTACSVSDFNTFNTNLSNPNLQSWNDLVTGLPTSCAQCILSQETDTHWQLIVTDSTGQNGFVNWGACYADVSHGTQACGKDVQYMTFCTDISCANCATQQDYDTCTSSNAVISSCQTNFGTALQSDCNATYAQQMDDACGSLLHAAAVVCGNGEPDGGTVGF